ncbi:hypothetical protein B5X24_HaOG202697 [Helicoverpa armigera]|uniref:Uncharacterized protein n=1 Tax=Helicoverpa armigera TaxID=29058 RepID=A0A2W1BWJ8_HELAM|nr:hypothetical protein B5X24_HaOG202697 [Helicoverpa armigera]
MSVLDVIKLQFNQYFQIFIDTAHELRCLRRWLHCMEGRLPPPSLAAARGANYHDLLRKLSEHKVSQTDCQLFH